MKSSENQKVPKSNYEITRKISKNYDKYQIKINIFFKLLVQAYNS